MPSVSPYNFDLLRHDEGEAKLTRRQHPRPEIEVSGFCAKCNNGWMNDLDLDVEPLLTTMLHGQRRVLGGLLHTFATWISKVAMVADTMQSQPALSQEHRDYIYDHSAPPPGWRIWLFAIERESEHGLLVSPITLVRPGGLGYVFTMALDEFGSQVLVLPRDEAEHVHPYEPEFVQPIWPAPPETNKTAWPETHRLPREQLESFSTWAAGHLVQMDDPPPPMPVSF